jgi:hypothetical protein
LDGNYSMAEVCDQPGGLSVRCVLHTPNGFQTEAYFLYTDDGRVHQLKSIGGEWRYLAVAA